MELFDLFDDDRKPLGKTIVRGEACKEGENRMVVHVVIFNSKGEMLIQQRQSTKKHWPSLWDISCGGCSIAGETSKESAHRELLEELGIDYDFSDVRPHYTINFERGFDDVYFLELDIDVKDLVLQEDEVIQAKWATVEEIKTLISEGKFIPYLPGYVECLFQFRKQRGVIMD